MAIGALAHRLWARRREASAAAQGGRVTMDHAA
jgi:hypothetical protein